MFNRKEYYQKNKEKFLENFKKWREKNLERNNLIGLEYRLKNKEKIAQNDRIRTQKIKAETIKIYGGKCNCCGETILDFLTIDHINNNGNIHRKEQGSGINFYTWLKKNNYPKENFQVLCFNCNLSKRINRGKCIHLINKEKKQRVG